MSQEDKGRLQATAGPQAGAFLNAVPNPVMNMNIPSPLFVTTLKWWLGLPVLNPGTICRHCGVAQDENGYHSLTCRGSGKLSIRHNAIAAILYSLALSAHLCPEREQFIGTSQQRSDVRVKLLGVIKDIDVSVTHPLRPAFLKGTADGATPSAADKYAAIEKIPIYAKMCAEGPTPTTFVSVSLDCFGNWSKDALKLLAEMAAARASLSSCLAPHVYERRILQQCAVAIMINNAKTIAKVREFRGAEGIPLDATAWSDGESDIDDDPVALGHTDAAMFDLTDIEGGTDAQVITLDTGTRHTTDLSSLGVKGLAKAGAGANPGIPPMLILQELAARLDSLDPEPPGDELARGQWLKDFNQLKCVMRDMTAAMRRERDALDTLEADEADATLVEEEWMTFQAAQFRAAAPPLAAAASPHAEELAISRDGPVTPAEDVDRVLEFLEEMACRQHGEGDWDAGPQKPERERGAEWDFKSKRDRDT